jgi:hypothetical protein
MPWVLKKPPRRDSNPQPWGLSGEDVTPPPPRPAFILLQGKLSHRDQSNNCHLHRELNFHLPQHRKLTSPTLLITTQHLGVGEKTLNIIVESLLPQKSEIAPKINVIEFISTLVNFTI